MSDYTREFPDFGLMDVAIPDGFRDNSWHNDAMPCFTKDCGKGLLINLWIDYANPNERESPSSARFWIQAGQDEKITTMFNTDDYAQALRLVASLTR